MTRRWVAVVETEPYLRKAEQLLSEDERAAVVEMLARESRLRRRDARDRWRAQGSLRGCGSREERRRACRLLLSERRHARLSAHGVCEE